MAARLDEEGNEVLLDDCDLRGGETFADADLIACRTQVAVGRKAPADRVVDVRRAATGEERELPIAEVHA